MRFKQFMENVDQPTIQQAYGVVKLMNDKYNIDLWAPNFQVAINDQRLLMHAQYAFRKNRLAVDQSSIIPQLQQMVDMLQLKFYPDQDVVSVNYNDSGCYDMDVQVPPGQNKMCRVISKGLAATINGNIKPIKMARVAVV